jgi:hypothetical protein
MTSGGAENVSKASRQHIIGYAAISLAGILLAVAEYQVYVSLSIFSSGENPSRWYFFSSDSMTSAMVYRDLFVDGFHWEGWLFLSDAPQYIHMVWFFLLRAVTGDFVVAHVLNALLWPLFLVIAFDFVARSISPKITLEERAVPVILGAFILFLFANHKALDLIGLFWVGRHGGIVLMFFLCLGLFLKICRTPKTWHYALLFFLCAASTVSDRMFIPVFIVPCILTVLIGFWAGAINPKTVFVTVAGIVVSMVVGLLAGSLVTPAAASGSKISPQFGLFWRSVGRFLRDAMITGDNRFWFTLFTALFIVLACLEVVHYLRRRKKENPTGVGDARFLFNLLSMLSVLGVAASVILTAKPVKEVGYTRYLLPMYATAAFGLVVRAMMVFQDRWSRFVPVFPLSVVSLFAIGLLVSSQRFPAGTRSVFRFYPPVTRCLDRLAVKHKIRYGLADYWLAKYNTLFSKKGLRIYTVYPDLRHRRHLGNAEYYLGGVNARNHDNPKYNFVVMGGLRPNRGGVSGKAIRGLGKPVAVEKCSGYRVFIYGKDMDPKVKAIFRNDRSLQAFYRSIGRRMP